MRNKQAQKMIFAMAMGAFSSAGSATLQQDLDSLEQDHKVQSHRHVFEVEKVIGKFFDVVFQGCAIRSLNLCPAGGARLHRPAVAIEWNLFHQSLFLVASERTRPDEMHVSAEDVVELWQLVQARAPQPASDSRETRIMLLRGPDSSIRVGICLHGAELVHRKDLPILAYTFLPKENGESGIQPDGQRD